ncbi:MAG: dephospho-CoA kinase [Bacteroidota bacterium]
MLKVGITGNIGSGKSLVCDMFKVYGIPVYDADSEARKLMENDETIIRLVKKEFGEESYTDNKLNRSFISKQVFADFHKLHLLNAITHPVIIQHSQEWMNNQNAPYVIKEAALIFESGSAKGLDVVIGIDAPYSLRVQRVVQRDGLSREEILKRNEQQIDQDMKMKLCDFVIINDNKESLIKQVDELHKKLLTYKPEKKKA